MSDIRKSLERFLRQQLFRPRDTPLERFVLRHAGVGSKGAEVEAFPVPVELDGDNVGIFLDEICGRAQADADGLGSKLQRYMLVACEAGRRDGPRFPFRLRGEGDDDGDGDGEEAPTQQGLVAQLMRHNEAMMRMLVTTSGQVAATLSRRLEQSEKFNETMIEQRHQYLQTMEETKSLQHERDMQLMLESGREERKGQLVKRLESLIPVVMAKMSGQEVAPTGPLGDVFQSLARSLSPDQLQAIAPLLSQEQQVLLITLLQAAQTRQGEAS